MLRPLHIWAGAILVMALALPFPAWALDWVSNGSSVNVPTGQTLETSGTGSIVSTSVSGSAADGSRLLDIEQNTDGNEPGDPTGDNSRLYCEKDFHDSGVDACLLHHGGDNNNGDRLLTEDTNEGTLLSQLASSPGDPPGTAYTAIYAKNDDNLYVHPEGGSEEQVCTSADISGCTASSGGSTVTSDSDLTCDNSTFGTSDVIVATLPTYDNTGNTTLLWASGSITCIGSGTRNITWKLKLGGVTQATWGSFCTPNEFATATIPWIDTASASGRSWTLTVVASAGSSHTIDGCSFTRMTHD